jgi:biotin carboxylase
LTRTHGRTGARTSLEDLSLSLALTLISTLRLPLPLGICTFCELSVPTVARLCEALGLPGSPSAAVDTARDKHKTRAAMKQAGLASPANFRVDNGNPPLATNQNKPTQPTLPNLPNPNRPNPTNPTLVSQLGEAMAVVGFPAVIKPISGAASLGVKKVVNEDEVSLDYNQLSLGSGTLYGRTTDKDKDKGQLADPIPSRQTR